MNRLKELRIKKGLTLQELSKETDISFGALGNYENERREPKLATWQKLADFFDVSAPYLQGVAPADLGHLFSSVTEYVYLMNTDFYDGPIVKEDTGFYDRVFYLANEIFKIAPTIDPINGSSILDYLDKVDIDDQTDLTEKDKEIVKTHKKLIGVFTEKKEKFSVMTHENLKKINVQIAENQNKIATTTAKMEKIRKNNPYVNLNWQLGQRNDKSIDMEANVTSSYKNMFELVYYLNLVQDNLNVIELDKVDNAISALKALLDDKNIVVSDDLKKFIKNYKQDVNDDK